MGIQSGEEEKEKKKEKPVIEKLELVKAPGDDDDWTYKTPPPHRPLKRARRTSEAKDQGEEEEKKKLRWDRVVSVIRDDGNASGSAKSSSDDGKERDGEELKSCIKTKVSKRFNQRIELMNES